MRRLLQLSRRGLSTAVRDASALSSAFACPTLREVVGMPGTSGDGLLAARSGAYTALAVTVDGDGVASVRLNRPDKQNAMNTPMWAELIDCFASASRDPDVRVAVLSGAGGNFSAGMDLSVFKELQTLAAEEPCDGRNRERMYRAIQFFQDGVSAPERCTKPVIGAIEGNVIGGGVDLVTACDLRYATASAKVSVKEIDLGIVADVGTMQRLPHLVGDQRARELTYTGRTISGEQAAAYGLALESFATAEAMMEHALGVARAIAAKSPLTVRGIKQTALYTRDHPTADALRDVAMLNAGQLFSEDLGEAMTAMAERRRPHFRGD